MSIHLFPFLLSWLIKRSHVAIAAIRSCSQKVNRSSMPLRILVLHRDVRIAELPKSKLAAVLAKCTMQYVQSAVLTARFLSSLVQRKKVAAQYSAKSASWHRRIKVNSNLPVDA